MADMLAFGGQVTISGLFDYFRRNLDTMLIGRMWGGEMPGRDGCVYKPPMRRCWSSPCSAGRSISFVPLPQQSDEPPLP
ncbi:hypothetical protein [Sphingomonas oleivorans]